jgi:hypothetical protein
MKPKRAINFVKLCYQRAHTLVNENIQKIVTLKLQVLH